MTKIYQQLWVNAAPFAFCVRVVANTDGRYLTPSVQSWLTVHHPPFKWPTYKRGSHGLMLRDMTFGISGRKGHRVTFRPVMSYSDQGILEAEPITEIWFEDATDAMIFKLSNEVI